MGAYRRFASCEQLLPGWQLSYPCEIERVARLIPVDGSATIDLDHGDVALPNMQRLAP